MIYITISLTKAQDIVGKLFIATIYHIKILTVSFKL